MREHNPDRRETRIRVMEQGFKLQTWRNSNNTQREVGSAINPTPITLPRLVIDTAVAAFHRPFAHVEASKQGHEDRLQRVAMLAVQDAQAA